LTAGYALLPAEINDHLGRRPGYGFRQRWVALEADRWILAFATPRPIALLRDQAEALTEPALRENYLDEDRAYDLDSAEHRAPDLARRIVVATRQRRGPPSRPGRCLPALIQGRSTGPHRRGDDSTD
jgi:hypothetical protein